MGKKLNLGVVGYCPPSRFDETTARDLVKKGFDALATAHPDAEITVVSGLTNVGVLKIAYEEARDRGWRTVGIACKKAADYELFPVDEVRIVGENWGDESATFVSSVDAMLRVGGGPQSKREAELVRAGGG